MHELSIAEALIEQIESAVADDGDARVVCVRLQLGALSGVDEAALAMAFPVAADGTCAAGARLDIQAVPACVTCRNCGSTTAPDFPFFVCEQCGSNDVEVSAGRELLLKDIEIET